MKVSIVEVRTRRQLMKFIDFPNKLYKGNEYYCPSLLTDEYATLDLKKNAASEFCEAKYWLAYDENKNIVGRVAGIINHKANTIWNKSSVRFGWIDFIEDIDVVRALIDTVIAWGREKGLNEIVGPLGFTDMDKEGLLVEGFDKICPFTCIYNFPYYDTLLTQVGLEKDADWIQRSVIIPEELGRLEKASKLIEEKYGLHCLREKNVTTLAKKYGKALFHMYNESFAPLYEFTPLTDRQIDGYVKTFASILDMDFVCVLVNEKEEMVGFAFCVPSLAKAMQKCKGRLFPFGFLHVLQAFKKNDTIEALMIGVLPEYQSKGAFAPMFKYIYDSCKKRGIKLMLNNPQLEDNHKVINLFKDFDPQFYMRRRCYKAEI